MVASGLFAQVDERIEGGGGQEELPTYSYGSLRKVETIRIRIDL
jgi:hypothetical protein